MSATRWLAFLPVAPGLEPVLQAEIGELLEGAGGKLRRGGVEVRVGMDELVRLARRSRVAESVRVRIGRFAARDFRALEEGLSRLPWDAYVPRGSTPTIRVRARRSKLIHSDAIAERVGTALARRGDGPGGEGPTVHVRVERDQVQVSIEAADEALHRRGWRSDGGAAPLRENLAAACLRASGWRPGQPLWDPFCGSGTLPIEALALTHPGLLTETQERQLQRWPTFDSGAWERGAYVEVTTPVPGLTLGSDWDEQAISRAERHGETAGAGAGCRFQRLDVAAAQNFAPEGAAVVTNTPYGKRLRSGAELDRTFQAFGSLLAARVDLDPVVALVAHPDFGRATGLPWETLLTFPNRGTPVSLQRLVREHTASTPPSRA